MFLSIEGRWAKTLKNVLKRTVTGIAEKKER